MAGIGIQCEALPSHDGFRVVTVSDGSPAQQAGLRVGDVIRAIDGRFASEIYFYEVYTLLHGPLNSRVVLTLQRGTGPARVVEVVRGPNQLSGIGAPRSANSPSGPPTASPPVPGDKGDEVLHPADPLPSTASGAQRESDGHLASGASDGSFRDKPPGWVELDILLPGEVPGRTVSAFRVGHTGAFHARGRRQGGQWFDADPIVTWSTDARCVVMTRQDASGCHVRAVVAGSGHMRAALTANPRDASQREFSVEKAP